MKAIRNVFAHSKFPVSFDTPEIAAEIRNKLYSRAIDWIKIIDPEWDEPISNRRAFRVWVGMCCYFLNEDHVEAAGEGLYWPT
jgi:hypothetical protein